MPPKQQNQYIPKYIKDVPVFLRDQDKDVSGEGGENGGSNDYLSHHRNGGPVEVLNSEPKVGLGIKDEYVVDKSGFPVQGDLRKSSTWKKGQCLNCGGDHNVKDCLERPKAKKKNADEEHEVGAAAKGKRAEGVDYDEKRDRWFGYDVKDYSKYVADWEEKKTEEGDKAEKGEQEREFDTDEEIELKELGLWEEYKKDSKKKQEGEKTVRLREDKAIYLKDFQTGKITYDPKSRMIRDETTGFYNEDNLFVRHKTGEALKFEQVEKRSAWENNSTSDKDGDRKFIVNPTLSEMQTVKKTVELSAKSAALKTSLMNKYNNDVQSGENDEADEEAVTSRYTEDVLINGHTSVFGSYYKDGIWGYRCCKQTDLDSVCTK
jgi:pre-mRNA-processing factor SLU7